MCRPVLENLEEQGRTSSSYERPELQLVRLLPCRPAAGATTAVYGSWKVPAVTRSGHRLLLCLGGN